jgi:hypothetical protein
MVPLIIDVILDETALPYPGQSFCSLCKEAASRLLKGKLHPSIDGAAEIFVPKQEPDLNCAQATENVRFVGCPVCMRQLAHARIHVCRIFVPFLLVCFCAIVCA